MNPTASPTALAACGYTQQWQKGARLISNDLLNVFGRKFLRDLSAHEATINRYSRGTGTPLARAMHGFQLVFRSTGKDNCLEVDRTAQVVVVNRDYFDTIANRALRSYTPPDIRDGVAVRRVIRAATRSTVRMVVGHELFHPEQGLLTIADLRRAATTAGWDDVARFDADADFRAAGIEAALSATDDGDVSYTNVLRRFEDALAFQLRYCVPIYGCPSNKPHKRSRAAGIAIQLARIAFTNRMNTTIDETSFHSLTMPIYVKFDPRYSRISILGLDPMLFLGSSEFYIGELKEFFDKLDSGDVEWLVKEAITLCLRLGLLPS